MQHIDQHTLELFALNAPAIAERRGAIEEHLTSCAGCRDLVARMVEAYGRTNELVHELNEETAGASERLPALSASGVVPSAQRRMAAALRLPTRMERTRYFIQRHPVLSGSGSFLVLAGLLLAGNFLFRSPAPPENPAFVRYNENSNSAEILDSNYKFLWSIPTRFVAAFQRIGKHQGLMMTHVRDVDGDGWNEVVTTLWHPGTTPDGDDRSLRVYEKNGNLRFRRTFAAHINYLNRHYEDNWKASFCIVPADMSPGKSIVATFESGRSPEVVVRFAADGTELGQYWHFGSVHGLYQMENGDSSSGKLIVVGIHDAEDSVALSVPFASILDPSRLSGTGKSAGSPGFNMGEADAEQMYIRFPASPLATALSKNSYASNAAFNRNGTISIWVNDSRYEATDDIDQYEYIFAPDMRVLQVKSTSATDMFYRRKAKEGVITGRLDAAYLAKLKDGVRYWDGEQWVKEATRIRHNIEVSQAQH